MFFWGRLLAAGNRQAARGGDLDVVLVSQDSGGWEQISPFLERVPIEHAVVLADPDMDLATGYSAPGLPMTILYDALMYIEQLTMDRDLVHLRDRLAPEVAEMVYYGFWFCPKMDSLFAFIREAQHKTTGEVCLNLYKGNIMVDRRNSPNSLYDEGIASMEGVTSSYDQSDAEGFLRIQGLPSRVQARVTPREY